MKAIIVAGGHGSRLLPMTNYTHKTLLPLCGRPIIDYAMATIRNAGIDEITIIGNRFIDKIREHVGSGVNYVLEEEPRGVAVFENGAIVDVVEKPNNPPSNLAIGGIYVFDETFWARLDEVQDLPNFSISDVTKQYIKEGIAKTVSVGENTWIDCGTPESLLRAGQMVEQGIFTIKGAF